MAYKNPETGRIYLAMNMAPICKIYDDPDACSKCPVYLAAKKHNPHTVPDLTDDSIIYYHGCHNAIMLFGDEIAEMVGYEKVVPDSEN